MSNKEKYPERLPGEGLMSYINRTASKKIYKRFDDWTEEDRKELKKALSQKYEPPAPLIVTPQMAELLEEEFKKWTR